MHGSITKEPNTHSWLIYVHDSVVYVPDKSCNVWLTCKDWANLSRSYCSQWFVTLYRVFCGSSGKSMTHRQFTVNYKEQKMLNYQYTNMPLYDINIHKGCLCRYLIMHSNTPCSLSACWAVSDIHLMSCIPNSIQNIAGWSTIFPCSILWSLNVGIMDN
jgi:hypothetical protein